MKKHLLLFTTFLFAFILTAQEINYGAKAGMNLSNLTGDLSSTSSRFSFHLGGFAEYILSEELSVQAELLYSAQGAKVKNAILLWDSSFGDATYRLNYLTLPFMGKYYITDKFTLEAGPQIGFLLSADIKIGSETLDIGSVTKGTDFGFNIGGGYLIDDNLHINLRYNLGLSNVFGSGVNSKNSVLQASIGYRFDI